MEAVYIDKHADLVSECRRGNRKAQFEIYKLYSRAMYNVALRIVNAAADAEDVLQEAFLDAFIKIEAFRGETSFGLWLKQIVIHKSLNVLRKRKAEFIGLDEVDVAAEDDDAGLEDQELKVHEIKEAMTRLADGYRVILSLYLFEGYDHQEIAYILKISENTSRTQYMRAKLRLTALLGKKGVKDE